MNPSSLALSPLAAGTHQAAIALARAARRALRQVSAGTESAAGLVERLNWKRAGARRAHELETLRSVLMEHHVQVVELHRPGVAYGAGTGLYAGTCYVVEDARSLFSQRRLTVERQRALRDLHGQSSVGLMVVGPAGMPVAEGVRHVVAEGRHGSRGC